MLKSHPFRLICNNTGWIKTLIMLQLLAANHHVLLFVSAALVSSVSVHAGEGVPPSMIGNIPTRYRVAIGTKSFKLVCPVKSDQPGVLMIQWKKDGEPIGAEWSPRFKFARGERELRIRNVAALDGGEYSCEAVNGFGHRHVDLHLTVFDESQPDSSQIDDDLPMPAEEMAPMWMNADEMNELMDHPLIRRVQSSLELRCQTRANPRPRVHWFKDDQPLVRTQSTMIPHRPWLLTLHHLTLADSGVYSCRVENVHGRIDASFLVKVTDVDNSPPEFDQNDPLNSTVREGLTATFLCKVRSSYPPFIRWLKQVDDVSKLKDNSTVISANGKDLMVLDEYRSATIPGADDVYMNRLLIPRVDVHHSGIYICVVTNPAGHMVYRSAHLSVTPAYDQEAMVPTDTQTPMHLIMGVPIAIFILLLVVYAVYCLQRNRQQKQVDSQQHHRNYHHHQPPPNLYNHNSCSTTTNVPPPPQRPPPSLPSGYNKSPYSSASNRARPYSNGVGNHHGAQSSTVPLNTAAAAFARHQQQLLLLPPDDHLYEPTTPQPPPSLSTFWQQPPPIGVDSDYDSDVGYPNGRLQPYPSMYSCR